MPALFLVKEKVESSAALFSSGALDSTVRSWGDGRLGSVHNPSKRLPRKGLTNAGYLDIISSGKELI